MMALTRQGAREKRYRALVVCCGRMDRGDDAVGPLCAAALEERRIPARTLDGETSELLDAWQGAENVIVVDAIQTGTSPPGTLHRLDLLDASFRPEAAGRSSHGLGLAQAIKLGRVLKCLPASLVLVGLEAASFEWAATLSPSVATAMPALVDAVEKEWRRVADVRPPAVRKAGVA